MKWPWSHHSTDEEIDVNEAAVAYVQAGVQSAVSDLQRSLTLLERTLKVVVPAPNVSRKVEQSHV